VDFLVQQPFYSDSLPSITAPQTSSPMKEYITINLDSDLNETDLENLQDMSFDLTSIVFKNKQIEETLHKIKTENRSMGQKLGKVSGVREWTASICITKETLAIYRQKIFGLEGAKQFVGRGLKTISDVIFYASVDDLCSKLAELNAARKAGNTGLDNVINSILDELNESASDIKRRMWYAIQTFFFLFYNIMASFILSGNTSDFITSHDSVILDPNTNYEAALLSLDTYNSIPNISVSKNNILTYSTDAGISGKT